MKVHRKLESFWQIAQSQGALMALLYAADRLARRVSAERVCIVPYVLLAQPVGGAVGRPLRDDAKTVVRAVAAGDEWAGQLPRPPEVNRARWQAGAQCFAAAVGGELAATLWIQAQRHDEEEVRCRYVIAQRGLAVWDFDLFLAPRFRFGRTFARLWTAVDAHLAAQGVRWTFSQISPFNEASLRSHRQLGALDVGRICFFVVGAFQLTVSSLSPRLHMGWRRDDRPEYQLRVPR